MNFNGICKYFCALCAFLVRSEIIEQINVIKFKILEWIFDCFWTSIACGGAFSGLRSADRKQKKSRSISCREVRGMQSAAGSIAIRGVLVYFERFLFLYGREIRVFRSFSTELQTRSASFDVFFGPFRSFSQPRSGRMKFGTASGRWGLFLDSE